MFRGKIPGYAIALFVFLSGLNRSYSQTLAPSVVNSAGGYGGNTNTNITWSVGESVVFTGVTPQNLVTQGFIQPSESCPADTNTVAGTVVCIGNQAVISIAGAALGVDYQAYIGSKPVGVAVTGTGNTIELVIPDSSINAVGAYQISVMALSVLCDPVLLTDTAKITVNNGPDLALIPQTSSSKVCINGNSVSLTLSNSQSGVIYQPYLNGVAANTQTGNGGTLTFSNPGSNLLKGQNIFKISALGQACPAAFLKDSVLLTGVNPPNILLTVNGSSICGLQQSTAPFKIVSSDTGVQYNAYFNNNLIAGPVTSTGGNITFNPNSSVFKTGLNLVTITASNGICPVATLSNQAAITLKDSAGQMAPISASGQILCVGSTIIMYAKTGYQGYQWLLNAVPVPGANQYAYAATTAGTYTVVGIDTNLCFKASDSYVITPSPNIAPAKPVIIKTGGPFACDTNPPILSISGTYAKYQWRANGIKIVGANQQTYNTVIAASYTIEITDNQGCSNVSDTLNIQLSPATPIPTITSFKRAGFTVGTFTDTLLESSVAPAYQWYANQLAIIGATAQTYKPLFNATYLVATTYPDGCRTVSAPYIISSPDYQDLVRQEFYTTDSTILIPSSGDTYFDFEVYPNPTSSSFTLSYITKFSNNISVNLYNSVGTELDQQQINTRSGKILAQYDITGYPAGVYLLIVKDGYRKSEKKITVIH